MEVTTNPPVRAGHGGWGVSVPDIFATHCKHCCTTWTSPYENAEYVGGGGGGGRNGPAVGFGRNNGGDGKGPNSGSPTFNNGNPGTGGYRWRWRAR